MTELYSLVVVRDNLPGAEGDDSHLLSLRRQYMTELYSLVVV